MAWLSGRDAEAVRSLLAELPREVVLHVFTRDDRLLIPGRDPSPFGRETLALAEEVAGLVDRVRVVHHDLDRDREAAERYGVDRAPTIVPVAREGEEEIDAGVRFVGLPAGFEFGSLLEAIAVVSRGTVELDPEAAAWIERLTTPAHIRVFTTPT